MRQSQDFSTFVDLVRLVRASGMGVTLTEGAVRAAFEEYKSSARDVRFLLAAERLALHPPKEATNGKTPGAPGKAPEKEKGGGKAAPAAARPAERGLVSGPGR